MATGDHAVEVETPPRHASLSNHHNQILIVTNRDPDGQEYLAETIRTGHPPFSPQTKLFIACGAGDIPMAADALQHGATSTLTPPKPDPDPTLTRSHGRCHH